jgi:P-type Mg2+ transporter
MRAIAPDRHTSPLQAKGLSSDQARQKRLEFGPNEVVSAKKRPLTVQFLAYFAQPLVLILLIAALASALLGDLVNASIIAAMVLGSIALDFSQSHRSQVAAEKLRAAVSPTASVLRDGAWQELPRRDLVPEDVIRLSAGDLVPADARLLEAKDLHVQQAALTGESMPVEKEAAQESLGDGASADSSLVFLGSSIVSGKATASVTATGARTQFGGIAASLSRRAPETEFERGTRAFGFFIMQTVLFLVLFVSVVSALNARPALESLLFAVALAVGLTPEFLPMITTITLANGAIRMSRQKVIVKNLAAIQNFGSIDILASDKTGTITSGEMQLEAHVDALGQPSERVFLLAYLNSLFETGVDDPHSQAVLAQAHADPVRSNPLDLAILEHAHPDVQPYVKLDEIPFDFERRRVSIVVDRSGEHLLIVKGAPESVLEVCTRVEFAGGTHEFDAAARVGCANVYQARSAQGERVLAVAYRTMPPEDQQHAYRAQDERDLTLAGFVSFLDPPLPDAKDVLEALRVKGVTVKILTCDNELVARHVCESVGLEVARVVLGHEIEAMTDGALGQVAEVNTVFARVAPAQKNRIIAALKARGHVVGYIGDGINDAPSLHAADVGISVANAVDVAKEAADIILLERGLKVLLGGILEGRKAFGNVMKYLLMGTSSNFGNMFSMAGASLLLPYLPMLPTQILINNFLYDLAQVTIPGDNVDEGFIQKPRRWNIDLIRRFMLWIGPISSLYDFLTFYVLLNVFHAKEAEFHTGWFVESLATQTLVIFVIRTFGNPLRSRPSLGLTLTALGIVSIGLALPFSPLAGPLGFVALPASYFAFLAAATLTYLGLVEIVKRRMARAFAS